MNRVTGQDSDRDGVAPEPFVESKDMTHVAQQQQLMWLLQLESL